MGRFFPYSDPARHGVHVEQDVCYDDPSEPTHVLDVCVPSGAGPHPVVLYAHGGAFRILSKDSHALLALAYARRGFVVFNISYRLAPSHPFPAAIEDACAAYAWVIQHAESYGGDLSRLVLAGESAGANLVTSLAIAATYRRPEPYARKVFDSQVVPKAVVAACGILQVTDGHRFRRESPSLSTFMNDRLTEVADIYLFGVPPDLDLGLADPLCLLETGEPPDRALPAFFAPVGAADPLAADTRRLRAALEKLGGECVDRYYPGQPHAFHALFVTKSARQCWFDTFEFLGRTLRSA